jgi:hypothetical protein
MSITPDCSVSGIGCFSAITFPFCSMMRFVVPPSRSSHRVSPEWPYPVVALKLPPPAQPPIFGPAQGIQKIAHPYSV